MNNRHNDSTTGRGDLSGVHPYTEDMINHMKLQESQFRKPFLRRSPQLECRRFLMDWLHKVVEKTRLRRNTLHLAAKLLDFFMDGHSIEASKTYLLAIACLTIAAKFEEKESRVPKIRTLIKCAPLELQVPYTNSEHVQLEGMVLSYFDWNIFTPTANAFVELLTPLAVNATDYYLLTDGKTRPIGSNLAQDRRKFADVIKSLLEISLQDCCFVEVTPSVMAASLIHSARRVCGLMPTWPNHLATVIGLASFELTDCTAKLLAAHSGQSSVFAAIDPEIVVEALPTPDGRRTRGRAKRKQVIVKRKSEDVAEDTPPTFITAATTTNDGQTKAKRGRKPKAKTDATVAPTGNEKVKGQQRPKKARLAQEQMEAGSSRMSAKADVKSDLTPTSDEGYGSFTFGSSGGCLAQQALPTPTTRATVAVVGVAKEQTTTVGRPPVAMSSIDILLQASDTIEATEIKHEIFKEEILREIAANNSVGTESTGTNIEGVNVTNGDVFLYTVVKSEQP